MDIFPKLTIQNIENFTQGYCQDISKYLVQVVNMSETVLCYLTVIHFCRNIEKEFNY